MDHPGKVNKIVTLSPEFMEFMMMTHALPRNAMVNAHKIQSQQLPDELLASIMITLLPFCTRVALAARSISAYDSAKAVLANSDLLIAHSRRDVRCTVAAFKKKAPKLYDLLETEKSNFTNTYYHHGYIWPQSYESFPTAELKKKANITGDHIVAVSSTSTKPGGLFTQQHALRKHTTGNPCETHRAFPKTPHHIAQAIAYAHFPMAQLSLSATAKMPVETDKGTCMVCGDLIRAVESYH
jgi:hypothetical protein